MSKQKGVYEWLAELPPEWDGRAKRKRDESKLLGSRRGTVVYSVLTGKRYSVLSHRVRSDRPTKLYDWETRSVTVIADIEDLQADYRVSLVDD